MTDDHAEESPCLQPRNSDADNPDSAAHDLLQAAAVLRQGLADESVPPHTDGLIKRLEQLASRLRSLPSSPPDSPPPKPEGAE